MAFLGHLPEHSHAIAFVNKMRKDSGIKVKQTTKSSLDFIITKELKFCVFSESKHKKEEALYARILHKSKKI